MKKTINGTAKTSKKKSSSTKKKIVKKNLNDAKKVLKAKKEEPKEKKVSDRILMYVYVDDMTQDEKKTMRRQIRAKIRQFGKKIAKLEELETPKKAERIELKKLKAELNEYKSGVHNPAYNFAS